MAYNCPKNYFTAVNFGYVLAIICTIIVMLIFDHGQPALLYLVPGCLIAVLGTSFYNNEFKEMWEFSEDEFITPPEEEEKKDESDKKTK
jgi:minor histocompatibility antigen H13